MVASAVPEVSDYLIAGAGIVGLSIARELKMRDPHARVTVLEKEQSPGRHSSGRNSGVLHSGIYYPPDSLKARVCVQGAREMAEYCVERGLPLDRRGKVLLPVRAEDASQLDLLETRAKANGVHAERIGPQQLKELEPEAHSATGEALWLPGTSVGDARSVMTAIANEATQAGIEIRCGSNMHEVDSVARNIRLTDGTRLAYGHFINAAGLHADSVAHRFGVGARYALLPFKGLYWKLDPRSNLDIRHLIYPVPDLRVPFLGIHTTTTTDGTIYLGPTAVPAFGRENYCGLQGVNIPDAVRIAWTLAKQTIADRDGFRRLAWQEGRRYFKHWFAEAAHAILPKLRPEHLLPSDKVGIRAQMYDRLSGRLVNDFLVERGASSTHILNAISPAWTSAFPLARLIVDEYIENRAIER